MTSRRELLKWSAALAALAAGPFARAGAGPDAAPVARAKRPLDLLFLGGTGFLGPHQVEYALARGHRVTLFNRGRSARDLYGDRVELLVGNRDARIDEGLKALAGRRRWDAVIDNSGYIPRHVRDSAELLKGRVGRYLFVSTVAVYDPAQGQVFDESGALRPAPPPDVESDPIGPNYGAYKAEGDRIVRAVFGRAATVVRPTFVFGPGDDTDRFTYWVERVARGGDVLGPPEPKRTIQWVDVRDLCPWIVELAERDLPGAFNAAYPEPLAWESLLGTLAPLAASGPRFHWATAEALAAAKIERLPLVPPIGAPPRRFVAEASVQAGLRYRPLADTARATLDWWRAQPPERQAKAENWPTPEQERAALAALGVGAKA